jgi:hypothetical protein
MSGFSADWLDLREAADHRARNAELRDAVARFLAGREHVEIVDLACGSGSDLRGLAPVLPARQTWRLLDHDPLLLRAAQVRLAAWADHVECRAPLVIMKADRRIEVELRCVDLAQGVEAALAEPVDLVAASAFFDLVSPQWITRFARALAARGAPLYAVLTYDGEESWSPPHEADAAMLAAFHAHQGRDKGLGFAAGPRAGLLLRAALEARAYDVTTAASPWLLDAEDEPLIAALAEGAARAVSETGLLPRDVVADWRAQRRTACRIGHVDLFARPLRIFGAAPSGG